MLAAYDFTDSGEGSYSVEAYNRFHYIDFSSGALIPILAASEAHLLILSAQLSDARISPSLVMHTFPECTRGQKETLIAAANNARIMAEGSLT